MSYAEIIRLKLKFNALCKNKNYQNAAYLSQSILNLYKKLGLTSGKRLADDCFDFACVLEEIGDFSEAVKLYGKSARLIKKSEGQTLAYSYRLNNLGLVYIKTGEKEKAIKYLEQCLNLREKLFGEKNEMTIQSLYNLGNACFESGLFEKSAFYLERSLVLRRKKDKDYIDNLNSLGYAYVALEDYDNAFTNLNNALGTIGETEGALSMEYISNLYFLANLLEELEEHKKANEYMEMFCALTSRIAKEKYPRFLKAFEGTISVAKNIPPINGIADKSDDSYTESLSSFSRELFKKGRIERCMEILKECLNLRGEIDGKLNIGYIKDLILLSSCYYEMGNVGKTINIFYEIVEIVENEKELFDECFQEMVKAFAEFDGIISEDEKGLIFKQITEFLEDWDFDGEFNKNFFDDNE